MTNPRCKHRILRVMTHTTMGHLVDCTQCSATFVVPFENMELYFTPFVHTSPKGPNEDITLLIHDSIIR